MHGDPAALRTVGEVAHLTGVSVRMLHHYDEIGLLRPARSPSIERAQWADEARERWGETDAYRESARRTASYPKEDWQRLKAESDAGLADLYVGDDRFRQTFDGVAPGLAQYVGDAIRANAARQAS